MDQFQVDCFGPSAQEHESKGSHGSLCGWAISVLFRGQRQKGSFFKYPFGVTLMEPTEWTSLDAGEVRTKGPTCLIVVTHLAMGQTPVQVNIPIPTKIGSQMGGEFTYPQNGIP